MSFTHSGLSGTHRKLDSVFTGVETRNATPCLASDFVENSAIFCFVKMEGLSNTHTHKHTHTHTHTHTHIYIYIYIYINKQGARTGEIPFCFLAIPILESTSILREHYIVQADKSILILTYCIIHMPKSWNLLFHTCWWSNHIHEFQSKVNPCLTVAISQTPLQAVRMTKIFRLDHRICTGDFEGLRSTHDYWSLVLIATVTFIVTLKCLTLKTLN